MLDWPWFTLIQLDWPWEPAFAKGFRRRSSVPKYLKK
jgi:hypothetical protein